MSPKSWVRSLFARRTRTIRNAPRPVRLGLEALGDRVLPSVTSVFAAGVLTVTGDEAANHVAVDRDTTTGATTVRLNTGTLSAPVWSQIGTVGPGVTITRIDLFGNAGDDRLEVGPTVVAPTQIDGGMGNDTLAGGAGDDTYRFNTDLDEGIDLVREAAGGFDTLDFSAAKTRGAFIDLGLTTPQRTAGSSYPNQLTLDGSVEGVRGTAAHDRITGNG